MNLSAFRWGRMAAYDMEFVEKEALPYLTNIEIDYDLFTENLLKTYEFTVTLGASTDTDDDSGNIIQISKRRPSLKTIREVLKSFIGEEIEILENFKALCELS